MKKDNQLGELAALCDLTEAELAKLIKSEIIPDIGAGIPTCTRSYIHWLRTGKKTVEECCELMDITSRHWTRLHNEGVVSQLPTGEPDWRRSIAGYIRYLRDGVTADSKELRKRKLAADTNIAERKDAEAAGLLVPRAEYEGNYTEAVTKICLAISRMKDLTAEKVIEAIKSVELEPLEFSMEYPEGAERPNEDIE